MSFGGRVPPGPAVELKVYHISLSHGQEEVAIKEGRGKGREKGEKRAARKEGS